VISVKLLNDEVRPAFERLLRDAWQQNWDDETGQAIIRWRYYERPNGKTWLGFDGDACVAMLDLTFRHHMLDGRRIFVCEPGDWFCLPDYRNAFGLNLLLRAREQGEPLLTVGGSKAAQQILPRFHFKTVSTAARFFVRPLTLRGLAGNLIRRCWWRRYERLAQVVPTISWRASKPHEPVGGKVRLLHEDDVVPAQSGDGLVQILEPWHWQWLLRMPPAMATPVGLLFTIGEQVVGCSVSQLAPTAADIDGIILHLQYGSPEIGRWVIATTLHFLRECGAGFARCCASTPSKFQLLKEAGFVHTQTMPVHWFARGVPLPSIVDTGYLLGDDGMPFLALRSRRLAEGGWRSVSRPLTIRPPSDRIVSS